MRHSLIVQSLIILLSLPFFAVMGQEERTVTIVDDMDQDYMASKVYELKHVHARDLTPWVLGAVKRYNKHSDVQRLNYVAGGAKQYLLVTTPVPMIPYVDDMIAKLDRPGKKDDQGTLVDGDGIYRFVYYPQFRYSSDLAAVPKFIGSGEGEFFSNDGASFLYWKDSKSDGGSALKWTQAMDRPLPQVSLKINVYEFSNNDLKEVGLDYVAWKNGPGAELFGFGVDMMRFESNEEIFANTLHTFSSFGSAWSGIFVAPQFDASFVRLLAQKGKARVATSSNLTLVNDYYGSYSLSFSPGYQNISKDDNMEISVGNDNDLTFNLTVNNPTICFDTEGEYAANLLFNYQIQMDAVIERNNTGTEFVNQSNVSSSITLATGTEKHLATFTREHEVKQVTGIPFLCEIPIIKYAAGVTTYSQAYSTVIVTVEAEHLAIDTDLSKWAGKIVTAVELLKSGDTKK